MYDFKKDFPLFKDRDVIYLDNAATAQKPACVIEAEKEFYEKHNANPLRGFYPLSLEATDAYEAARKTVQHFIHAASETEIILTRNTTESLNLVAYSYGLIIFVQRTKLWFPLWNIIAICCRGRWWQDRPAQSLFIWNVKRMVV